MHKSAVNKNKTNCNTSTKALTFLKGVCILVFIIGRRSQKDDQDIFVQLVGGGVEFEATDKHNIETHKGAHFFLKSQLK